MLRRFAPLVAIIIFASLGLNSVAISATEPIRIQMAGEPSSLDPARVFDQYAIGILRNVVEGLFILDADGHIKNGLVDSYQVSKDGRTYRFKLRKDAKWSDGKPVTVDDCIFGLMRTLEPKTASPDVDHFYSITGAREYSKSGKGSVGVTREGEELVIKLDQPQPSLNLILSLPSAGPMRKDTLEANAGKWRFDLPVTGAYKITSYKPSEEVRLEPNPLSRAPGLRPIHYRILPEEITAMNLFETGKMDIIMSVVPTEVERLKKKGLIKTAPSTTVIYLAMNSTREPMNDPSVRRAIASSIDRTGLVTALRNLYEPSYSYVPKNMETGLPSKALNFPKDVAAVKARALKPRIRLAYADSASNKMIAEKIQSDLKQTLGLALTLEPMELKTLIQRLFNDPPEMYFLGKSAFFDDPYIHLDSFSRHPQPNFARYESDAFEKLLEKIKSQPFGKERSQTVREANALLIEKDAVVVPLLTRMQIFGVQPTIKNFQVSPYQVINLGRLEK